MSNYDDDFDDRDYGDNDSSTETGSYEDEDLSFPIELAGDDLLIVKEGNSILAKFPIKSYKEILEKRIGKELTIEELRSELSKYNSSIHAEADCSIGTYQDHYGADADGNRGINVTEYNDDSLEVEVTRLDLRLIDEDGNVLGGEDFYIELEDCPGLEEYIKSVILSDISKYINN